MRILKLYVCCYNETIKFKSFVDNKISQISDRKSIYVIDIT